MLLAHVPKPLLLEPADLADLDVGEGDHFYIPGTHVFSRVDDPAAAYARLDRVPPGRYERILHASDNNIPGTDILDGEIALYPEETELVGSFPAWEYKARITINTSESGAGIEDFHRA